MYARRIPAINRAAESGKLKVDPSMTKESMSPTEGWQSGADSQGLGMNAALPSDVKWPADNYNHLLEQPTQFYAVAIGLALIGADDKLNVNLAWGYVGVRVVHSLVQSLANPIMKRFYLFATSSMVLTALTARGALTFFS